MEHSIKLRNSLLVTLFFVTGALPCAHADLRVQVEESVNGAKPAPVTHWFGDNRTMRDDGSRYVITSLTAGESIIVNRESHTYQVVPLKLQTGKNIPEVIITRTEDTSVINGWKARRYRLSGPATRELTIDVWISQDPGVDFSSFRELMIKLGNRPGSEWLKAYEILEGFPVLQEVELSRPGLSLKSQSRVLSMKEVEADEATIYQAPDYYKPVP